MGSVHSCVISWVGWGPSLRATASVLSAFPNNYSPQRLICFISCYFLYSTHAFQSLFIKIPSNMISEPSISSEISPHPSCVSKSILLLLLLTSRSFTRLRPFSLLSLSEYYSFSFGYFMFFYLVSLLCHMQPFII